MANVARKGTFGTFEKVKILINNRVRDAVVDQEIHFLAHVWQRGMTLVGTR